MGLNEGTWIVPIQDALDAVDDLVTYLEGEGYVFVVGTDSNQGDSVFWDLSFDGAELDENDTNPGAMPRLVLVLSVLYTSDFIKQEKELMTAVMNVYPKLIAVAGGQVEDERVSYSPDPDSDTRPDRIGMALTFTHRDGLVSLKD